MLFLINLFISWRRTKRTGVRLRKMHTNELVATFELTPDGRIGRRFAWVIAFRTAECGPTVVGHFHLLNATTEIGR